MCRVINLQLLGIGSICGGMLIANWKLLSFACIDQVLIENFMHRLYLGLIINSTNIIQSSFLSVS